MNAPLVSVIIPTYNRAELLKRSVGSLLKQTYPKLEIIIVDDASSDETPEVIQSFEDHRIVYLRHPENLGKNTKGGQAARNTGIQCAHGQLITFLDSDDEFLSEKIEKQVALFADKNVGAATCGGYIVHKEETEKKECVVPELSGEVYRDVLNGPSPPILGLMVRKNILDQIGPLDEGIIGYQEWDLFIQLAGKTLFAFLPEKLFVVYSWREDTPQEWVQGAAGFYQVIQKHETEMVRVCGRDTAIKHYKHACIWAFARADGDIRLMRKILWATYFLNPLDMRPLLHFILLGFGLKTYNRIYKKIKGVF